MRGKDNHRTAYTGGQMALKSYIEELGFHADLEVEFKPFIVDIYVAEAHAAIEYDGAHSFKSRDEKRDLYLMENYTLPILRITNCSPKKAVKGEISDFLFESLKTKERRSLYGNKESNKL